MQENITITISQEDAKRYAYWSTNETLGELLGSGGALLSRLCREALEAQHERVEMGA